MTPYQKKVRRERVQKMLKVFRKMFPNPLSELEYTQDFEFLFAVIMSAQSTDKQVNKITKKLFQKYRKLEDYANVPLRELERDIASIGLFRSKAKYIQESAKMLIHTFDRKIPRTITELRRLPGVGRKTANVVLSNLYGIYEGIAVDTHVMRLAKQFDLVDEPFTPVSIERDLMEIVSQKEWGNINHYFVLYGRYYYPAHAREIHDKLTAIYPKANKKYSIKNK